MGLKVCLFFKSNRLQHEIRNPLKKIGLPVTATLLTE